MMNSGPEEFQDLNRLLAIKRHEQPPPGYFSYLPDQIMVKIERGDLSEHSSWWEWMVERFDARPILAGAYAFAISGLMLLGFKVSQDLQTEAATPGLLPLAEGPHPLNVVPGESLQKHFANPAGLLTMTSTDPVFEEPAISFHQSAFQTRVNFAH